MHEYPLDHPLRRIALAYFENYKDEVGIRYALQCLDAQLSQFDFDEQEFEDCLDFIINELLYNEEELLIAAGLHTLCALILKDTFPESYRMPTVERLAMVEETFREEGVALAALVECLLGVWIHWDDALDLQNKAKELLDSLGSDESNVGRFKALACGLGASMLMPGISDSQAAMCLGLLQGLLRRNEDWRVKSYVTQSLSLALREGFVASQEKLLPLMALVEGFLGDPYPQSLYRPVAEFFSKVLTLGGLDEDQANCCWQLLFKLPSLAGEGATQRAALQQLGIAMHWRAMTSEQETHCYNVFRNALDSAEEERTLYDMMIVLAQAIAGMYSWGRIESLQRWGGLFAELLLEVEPPAAYSCLNTFLRGPMAKVCFSQENLDQLANDVICYAENDEKGRFLCVQVLDGMVSSSLLNGLYFERFWAVLSSLWNQGQVVAHVSFWEYLSRSASGLVTDSKASGVVRDEVFKEIVSLLKKEPSDSSRLLPLVQVFPVFIALSVHLPKGALAQSISVLLSLIEHENRGIRIAVLDGLGGALNSSALPVEALAQIAESLLKVDATGEDEGVLTAYAQACQFLQENLQASEAVRAAARQRLSLVIEMQA